MGVRLRLLAVVLAAMFPLLLFLLFYHPEQRTVGAYFLIVLTAGLCSTGAALLIAQSALRRVRLLDSAARQLGEGNYAARMPVGGTDEISEVATTFNRMAEKLEEREHRLVELDDLKSEFVGRVSHELRTPLTTIKTLTRLMLRGGITDEKQREYLDTISVECDRQIDLVLNLLDLSRIEGGVYRLSMERVDLAELVASCVKSERYTAEKRSHTLRMEPFIDVPPVCADPNTLRRVLINLIENSIKYTPDGGLIKLSASGDDDFAAVSVADNGRGIPHEDLPILFDKFYRGQPAVRSAAAGSSKNGADDFEDADASGIGLGLYVAAYVMEKMDGRISVETEVGRGSTFTLHLPVCSEAGCMRRLKEREEDDGTIAGC